MSAPLHKMVNGEKIFLTEQESQDLRARWAVEAEKGKAELLERQQKIDAKQSGREKLAKMGLSSDEIDAMLSN